MIGLNWFSVGFLTGYSIAYAVNGQFAVSIAIGAGAIGSLVCAVVAEMNHRKEG